MSGQAIQTHQQQQQNKLQRLHAIIAKKQEQIARALPQHGALTPERMIRIVMTSVSMNKALWSCTEQSLLAAVMQAAQLGLEPDGALGMASLVPYGTQCQLIIGYRGYIQLALRTGMIKDIRTRLVYEGDEFEVTYGLEETIHHVPRRQAHENARVLDSLAESGPTTEPDPIAVYGVAVYDNGGRHFEVLYREEIARIRECSKGWKHPNSPWQQWKGAMWRKTAVKQTLKYCPLAAEDAGWVSRADRADGSVYSDLSVSADGSVHADRNEMIPMVEVVDYEEAAAPQAAAPQAAAPQAAAPRARAPRRTGVRKEKPAKQRQTSSKLDQHVQEMGDEDEKTTSAEERQLRIPGTEEQPYDGPPDDYVSPPEAGGSPAADEADADEADADEADADEADADEADADEAPAPAKKGRSFRRVAKKAKSK